MTMGVYTVRIIATESTAINNITICMKFREIVTFNYWITHNTCLF